MIEHSAAAKAVVDDELFTRLLEAAYIIQQRQNANPPTPSPDFSHIVGHVLQTQRAIRTENLDLGPALQLVSSRLREITGAVGVAIGRTDHGEFTYVAADGSARVLAGSSISVHASSSARCLGNGEAVKSYVTQSDNHPDLQLCKKLGAESFLAVPVLHHSAVAGAIELFFSRPHGFAESEIRAAELMAGVVNEVLTQDAEQELKQELESERASVLSALESLKPQLRKLAGEDETSDQKNIQKSEPQLCRACGQPFAGEETSCEFCGASRATGKYPGAQLQSKWAALWERQLIDADHGPSFRRTPSEFPNEAEQVTESNADDAVPGSPPIIEAEAEDVVPIGEDTGLVANSAADTSAIVSIADHPEWQSAQHAKEWLETQIPVRSRVERLKKIIATRAGDLSLLLAGIVFVVVMVWGFWPPASPNLDATVPTVSAVKRKTRPRPRQLSLFEKLLVATGLAVPPPPPEYMGSPNVRVWVDLQTGLYYCPGAPLYGASPKGKYTSQSDAQQDQFEPAVRRPCD